MSLNDVLFIVPASLTPSFVEGQRCAHRAKTGLLLCALTKMYIESVSMCPLCRNELSFVKKTL